jgi:hypothetical protein
MPGFDRERVLALAALASSGADQDPIDAAIQGAAAKATARGATDRLVRFVPLCRAASMKSALGTHWRWTTGNRRCSIQSFRLQDHGHCR